MIAVDVVLHDVFQPSVRARSIRPTPRPPTGAVAPMPPTRRDDDEYEDLIDEATVEHRAVQFSAAFDQHATHAAA